MKQRIGLGNYAVSGVLLSLVACAATGPETTTTEEEATTSSARRHHDVISDAVVREWTQIAVNTIGAQPPFPSTRFMATVELAMFEAVNTITGKYEAYLGTVSAAPGASPQAAAAAAAHAVLKGFFPAATATLDAKLAATLATLPDDGKADGVAAGQAAGAAMLANRTGDGSAPPAFYNPPTPGAPGEWQRTASCGAPGGAFAHWQNVKPFGIQSSSQFRADAPPALGSKKYANDFEEVVELGNGAFGTNPNRSTDREDVVKVYGAQPPHQGWNQIALQIIATRNDDISDTVRTLALMNLSLSDSHISVFESKYFYKAWRPITAVAGADTDGNNNTDVSAFTSPIPAPCFPSYPSAHGVGAGAASRVLEKAYGKRHDFTVTTPSLPLITLHYDSIADVVSDVSDARVYGGIHFRFDQDGAEKQGKKIANYNLDHVLQKQDDERCDD
ncbi:MAG: superfamily protein [Myxococcales bacterium]|nr:superfamily protein [Myxococcales bacterium]